MKIGKISPTIWNRSVKKKVHISQTDGSFSWADASVCGDHAGIGYYAVLGAAGELASRKIRAEGISLRILFPETADEDFLAAVCEEIQKGCERIGAKVTSLSAEGTAVVQSPVVYASAAGTTVQNPGMYAPVGETEVQHSGMYTSVGETEVQHSGMYTSVERTAGGKKVNMQRPVKNRELLLCGYAGLEGSLRILESAEEELSQRFISTFLVQAKRLRDQLVMPEQILAAAKGRNTAIRQIGSGGILAALWEMSEEEQIGFEIAMGAISLKQETVEICEYYRLNPYQMTSAGSYLILTDEADRVIEVLEKSGARAVRLGVAKAQNARVITSRDEVRYLDRPAPDELARWQKEHKKHGE